MTTRGAKATCDRYFSQLVRMRGACQRCGDARNLECAHIIRRRFVGNPDGIPLRHNVANAWCLCSTCHRTVDSDPVEFAALVDRTIGADLYRELVAVKQDTGKRRWRESDWIRERTRLRELLRTCGTVDRSAW